MAIENFVNGTEIVSALSNLPGLEGLIKIGQVAGILVIAYLAFLLLRGFLGLKHALRLRRIDKSVQNIDANIAKLVSQKSKGSKKPKGLKKSKKK